MPRKAATPGRFAKSKLYARWKEHKMLLQTPRGRGIALAVAFVTVAMFSIIAWRQGSSDVVAAEPDAVAAERTTSPRTPATRDANRTSQARSSKPAPASRPAAVAPNAEATTQMASVQQAESITVTGCLERDDERFRLKDTEGEDAPQGRSWTTGFIKRSNRSIRIVDARNRFNLTNHVGERVSATGTLVDGDMQIRSLRRIAASCEKEV